MPIPAAARLGAVLLMSCVALGCAGSRFVVDASTPDERLMPEHVIPSGEGVERTEDGLVRVETPGRALVYAKPPRPHLQRYQRMYVDVPQIRYKAGVRGWSAHSEAALMEHLRRVFIQELGAGGAWELAEEPGEGVLFVLLTLLDVDIETSRSRATSSTTIANASGGAVLVLEFFDSVTTEPLYRHIERRRLPGGLYSASEVDRVRLKRVVSDFAQHFSDNLRTQFAAIREIERRERLRAEQASSELAPERGEPAAEPAPEPGAGALPASPAP